MLGDLEALAAEATSSTGGSSPPRPSRWRPRRAWRRPARPRHRPGGRRREAPQAGARPARRGPAAARRRHEEAATRLAAAAPELAELESAAGPSALAVVAAECGVPARQLEAVGAEATRCRPGWPRRAGAGPGATGPRVGRRGPKLRTGCRLPGMLEQAAAAASRRSGEAVGRLAAAEAGVTPAAQGRLGAAAARPSGRRPRPKRPVPVWAGLGASFDEVQRHRSVPVGTPRPPSDGGSGTGHRPFGARRRRAGGAVGHRRHAPGSPPGGATARSGPKSPPRTALDAADDLVARGARGGGRAGRRRSRPECRRAAWARRRCNKRLVSGRGRDAGLQLKGG